jgi:dephospho-CoA kinase
LVSWGLPSATKERVRTMEKHQKIIACITGMPGAGKSTVADVAKDLGFEIFRMGDDVRIEAEKRNLPPTDENLGMLMLELRQKGGSAAIAKMCKKRIEQESKSKLVTVDGIRNMNEFLEFKNLGKAILIAVHASPEKRYKFLRQRQRSDSPSSLDSFEARDRRELSVGVGEPIAMADEVIINSSSLEELKSEAERIFLKLKEGDCG